MKRVTSILVKKYPYAMNATHTSDIASPSTRRVPSSTSRISVTLRMVSDQAMSST